MKVKYLKNKQEPNLNAKVMACLNRGIPPKDIPNYLSNSYSNILPAEAFGEELLKKGAKLLVNTISANKKAFLIQDSDCDGMTSAAILINYLYEIFPSWVENNLEWGQHTGKQHGINDFVDTLVECDYSLLIVPDAGTNDIEAIEKLHNVNCETLILDHHISDVGFSEYAITINSQYNYPNSQLSGAGVVLKFCQYLDKLLNKDKANNFLDLAAIGLMGDMQSMTSLETKEMILEGLQDRYIKNPLIYGLKEKAEFALSKADYAPSPNNNLSITPMGAAFFIIPLLNAICRSGTEEEKNLIFKAMLTKEAFKEIPSTKRGHKLGETEQIVTQALRVCTNVKNRQTRAEDAGMELLTARADKMLDNKVLVFALEPDEISSTISGLVSNKLASRYQRPCYILFKNKDGATGSGRGYTQTGIENMKKVAESSKYCNWCRGHENAHGASLNNVDGFVSDMNEILKDISTEIVHYVDYIWDVDNINGQTIIELSELNDYLGTDFPRPLVYVKDCKINDYMIMKDKHLKINLPNGVSALMWDIDEDFKDRLLNGDPIIINFVAKCNINEYNWERKPQLIIEDFEEIVKEDFSPVAAWGF